MEGVFDFLFMLQVWQLPVDGRQAGRLEGGIGFGEMAAAEEPAGSGKRRRVRGFQHRVAGRVDPLSLALGVAAP